MCGRLLAATFAGLAASPFAILEKWKPPLPTGAIEPCSLSCLQAVFAWLQGRRLGLADAAEERAKLIGAHGRIVGRLVVGQEIDVRCPHAVVGSGLLRKP